MGLPDKGLDEDVVFGALDLREHVLVEPPVVGVELHPLVSGLQLDLRLLLPREPFLRRLPEEEPAPDRLDGLL